MKTIFTFTGVPDSLPSSALVIGAGGSLYGTTGFGGSAASGSVFKLTPPSSPGGTWTESELHTFTGQNGDGAVPMSGVTIGNHGVLYGTTFNGGGTPGVGAGTVFELKPQASPGAWTEKVLYAFTDYADGGQPRNGVVIGNGGTLYGTASSGGAAGCGTIFALRPPTHAGGAWAYHVLHSFTGTSGDGCTPFSALTIGKNGVLYGATANGGDFGCGMVFQLSPAPAGGTWTETPIYSFAGVPDGVNPMSTLVLSGDGNLFGTTNGGGTSFMGTAFELKPPVAADGAWVETVIHSFGAGTDGSYPLQLTIGKGGILYGATGYTGSVLNCTPNGCGTVFELKPPSAGTAWTETVLHNFTGQNGDGAFPAAGVVINTKGLLYGTTVRGGGTSTFCPSGCGVAFELIP